MEAGVAARTFVGHERRQRGQSTAGLLGRNRAILLQAAEHVGEPLLRAARVPVGTEIIRTLGQTRKQRAFLDRELLRRLAEIAARGELDPPGAAAEIDGIEIEVENLRLAERTLDPRRHDHLANLALVGQVFAHQQVLDDLLSDGRAALRAPGRGEIADEGADQAALVDPLMLIEAFVLGREKSLLHLLGDVGEWNPHPPLVLLEYLREAFALAVEHDARARKLEALELGVIGQIGSCLVVEVDDVAEVDRRRRHVLVLAELPVGGLQIGKIDAVKNLALAGDRLRVVHGGGDQLLEVDVLDVECLAHVRAARAQKLCHLLLILGAIEACFHRIRRGRDLTERQRGRKDFDQDRFHPRPKARTAPALSHRYKMAFWGVRFLVRRNLVIACSLLGGSSLQVRPATDGTNSSIGEKHPIENSAEIYPSAAASPGMT